MNLMMRTTIGLAVATALAVYVFTPTIAKASYDAGSPTAVLVGTSEQDNTEAEQTGDQGEMQVDQSVEQADQGGEQQS